MKRDILCSPATSSLGSALPHTFRAPFFHFHSIYQTAVNYLCDWLFSVSSPRVWALRVKDQVCLVHCSVPWPQAWAMDANVNIY